MTGHDPDRRSHAAAAQPQFDHRHVISAVLAAVRISARATGPVVGRRRAHDGGIVPGELGERFWAILAANRCWHTSRRRVDGVRLEYKLEFRRGSGRRGRGRQPCKCCCQLSASATVCRAAHSRATSRRAARFPNSRRIRWLARCWLRGHCRRQCRHDFVAGRRLLARQHGHEFDCRTALIQRLDQRLHDRPRAIDRSGVAPGFEKMRSGNCQWHCREVSSS